MLDVPNSSEKSYAEGKILPAEMPMAKDVNERYIRYAPSYAGGGQREAHPGGPGWPEWSFLLAAFQ